MQGLKLSATMLGLEMFYISVIILTLEYLHIDSGNKTQAHTDFPEK